MQYDVRLARCELAAARRERDATSMIHEALRKAESAGHFASAARLRELLTTI